MGTAHELGRVIGPLMIIFILILLVIPVAVGIFNHSWLGFFITLLVESVMLYIAFKVDDRMRENR